jgi:hypothetical protein
MVAGAVFTDTSYYQVPLNNSYPHGLVSFRSVDGTWEDPIFRTNLRQADTLIKNHRIISAIAYLVYRPGDQVPASVAFKQAVIAALGQIPRWLVAMIDAESWGGEIRGDQSVGLNRLYALLAAMFGGDPRRVLGYANRGDFEALWPTRPPQMRTVIASYGGSLPSFPNLIAWQYTNGQYEVAGLQSSTTPFGPCDHNVAPAVTPAQFAEQVGAIGSVPADPLEEVMAMYSSKAAFEAMLDTKLGIDPRNADKTGRTSVNALFAFWLSRTMLTLRRGTPNAAFKAPVEIVDGLGLQGTLAKAIAVAKPSIDQAALDAAVAAAMAPLFAEVAEIKKTLHEAINGEEPPTLPSPIE